MIYSVAYGNSLIYDPRVDELRVRDTSLHIAANESGSFDFTVDYSHPESGSFTKMLPLVEVLQDGNVIYKGRIINSRKDFNNSEQLQTEGILAVLNDTVIPPFSFPEDFEIETGENPIEALLNWIIDQHNEQSEIQFTVGTVSVTDPNDYIVRSSENYSTSWQCLSDKLFKSSLGGYILLRFDGDENIIDYVTDFSLTNMQEVNCAGNLLDMARESNGTELFSAVLPIGADGLTISGYEGVVPTGYTMSGNVISRDELVGLYGTITKVVEHDAITVVDNLFDAGVSDLASSGIKQTITVNAIDLKSVDGTETSFRVGRNIVVNSQPHGMSSAFPLISMTFDIQNPGNTLITLSNVEVTATDFNADKRYEASEQLAKEMKKQTESVRELGETTQEQITQVLQSTQEIIFTALDDYAKSSDVESLRETISSQLSIMADNIELSFTTATEKIDRVNDDLQRQISEMTKYFRFTADGLIIGENGNELTLRLDNDIIEFIRNNIPQLFIDEDGVTGDVIRASSMLRVGNYAWIAESDGRISLRKVTA